MPSKVCALQRQHRSAGGTCTRRILVTNAAQQLPIQVEVKPAKTHGWVLRNKPGDLPALVEKPCQWLTSRFGLEDILATAWPSVRGDSSIFLSITDSSDRDDGQQTKPRSHIKVGRKSSCTCGLAELWLHAQS